MTLPSIRRRLARVLLKASLAWGLLVVLLVGLVMRQAVNALLDSTMQEAGEILYALVQPLAETNNGAIRIMPPSPHDERLVWQVISASGKLQARSVMSPAELLVPLGGAGFSDRRMANGSVWRVHSTPLNDSGSVLHVAQDMRERNQQQAGVALVTLGVALLVGFMSSAWLRRRVRTELEPLIALSAAVARHDPATGPQLPPATREELMPLRDAIVALGERLTRLLDKERAFTAHAAHTLRTPLAGMDAQLAAAMQESPPELLPRLRRARDALTRLNHVVVALLHMFRSGRDLHPQEIDLSALIAGWPFEGLEVRAAQSTPLVCDPDLLTAALLNLLDNSVRHGASRVCITVLPSGSGVVLQVSDDGSGMDVARLQAVQRAIDAQDYSGGLGLGLTLADLVARAHHGRLRLVSGGRGLTVEITCGSTAQGEDAETGAHQ